MSDLGWGSLTTTIWPSGRGGPGLIWRWRRICLSIISAAGRFSGNGVDAAKLLDENARRFAEKWGLKETNGKPVMLRPWQGAGTATHAKARVRGCGSAARDDPGH